MSVKYVRDQLEKKKDELMRSISFEWRYPPKVPRNPLSVRPENSWPIFKSGPGPWKKNGKNWFYADVVFPESRNGLRLAGRTAHFFISGWQPFTLWVDGKELYKEDHTWKATGPIADPFPATIEPGRQYRLVACVEPTELPERSISLRVRILIKDCVDLSVDLDAASMQLQMAVVLAKSQREKTLVTKAAEAIDLWALRRNRWERVRASIVRMEQILLPLSAKAKAITVHLIGHTHIDMDWMWVWPDTVKCVRRDFKAVTDLMDDYPELTFTHSQVSTYNIVQKSDPAVYRKIRKRIGEGRWENAAGTWVEGDLNMADGESIARHMLYAADWTLKHLGTKAKVLWEPDTFGHPGNMPQLARLGEFDCYFHSRCNPGKGDTWPVRTWVGIDGTSITAFTNSYNGDLRPEKLIGTAIRNWKKGIRNALHMWGIGDHGGSLARRELEILAGYRHKPLVPMIRFSTMKDVLAAVRGEGGNIPVNTGETYSVFEGCFTTHASIKRYNRLCEGNLLAAESLCALVGLDRRKALREVWELTLFNQFHDILDGAAVHDTYINAHKRAEQSLKTAARLIRQSVKLLAKPVRSGRTLAVINPLGFERTEPVRAALPNGTCALRDSEGNVVPVQKFDGEYVFIAKGIPAYGHKYYRIMRGTESVDMPSVDVKVGKANFTVETNSAVSRISLVSGAICSFFDKWLKREFVGYNTVHDSSREDLALNVFQIIDEAPTGMSAWRIRDILKQENLLRGAKVKLVETGVVFARFRVEHRFRSSRIREDILYYRDFPRVDFDVRIDWREKGDGSVGVPQLKVSFATDIRSARTRGEGPFSVMERPADGMEYPTQKWTDLTGKGCGFALYNDSKYGYDALGGRMRITLLRNSYDPDPESDNGVHRVRFAFEPHGPGYSNSVLVRAGMAFNRSLVSVTTNAPVKAQPPALRIEGTNSVVCTSFRMAEHSDGMLLRLFECNGKRCCARIRLGKQISSAQEVNFHENPVGGRARIDRGAITALFHPYEVKTFLVKAQ